MRGLRFLAWLAAAALAGFVVFGVMVWRAVDVTDAPPADAERLLEDARHAFGDTEPLLSRGPDGQFVRRRPPPPDAPEPITHIYVLSYRAESGRLTRADVPFWFFRLKAPAAQFVVRDTGLDLSTLGLTASDLLDEGPALILDETEASGSRLLVWTE